MGDPQDTWFIMENFLKTDDLGVPPLKKTSMCDVSHTDYITYPASTKSWFLKLFATHAVTCYTYGQMPRKTQARPPETFGHQQCPGSIEVELQPQAGWHVAGLSPNWLFINWFIIHNHGHGLWIEPSCTSWYWNSMRLHIQVWVWKRNPREWARLRLTAIENQW